MEGDFSFEELRWAQVQAARQGASTRALSQEFQAAEYAQQQQFAVHNSFLADHAWLTHWAGPVEQDQYILLK